MTIEMLTLLFGISGALLTILLSVNAYFFKDMVKSLKTIELQLTKLTTQHDRVSGDVDFLMEENRQIRERLHSLEGASSSVHKYLTQILQGD